MNSPDKSQKSWPAPLRIGHWLMAITTLVGSRIGHPLPLWMGVLGHEGGTLLVVLNSLMLLAFRAETVISVASESGPSKNLMSNQTTNTT